VKEDSLVLGRGAIKLEGPEVALMPLASLVAIASLASPGLWTGHDPFVGKWKLDVSRSLIVDQMTVEVAQPRTFTFRFEGSPAETVVADGTDHPGLPGTTLAVKAADARTLSVVRKQGGQVIVSAHWKLAADGRTLRDDFNNLQPDGSTPPSITSIGGRRAARASPARGKARPSRPA
jgi:hypothetical protein